MAPPLIYGVLVGEVCYNLRAALDYLVYELAINDSGQLQEGTQFPIEDSPDDFAVRHNLRAGRRCYLRGLNSTHIAAIERLQPYAGTYWPETLRNISNPDKHKTLTVQFGHRSLIVLVDQGPSGLGHLFGPVYRACVAGGREVDVQLGCDVFVLFRDGAPVVNTLQEIKTQVRNTLEAFKPEFEQGHDERPVGR